MPDLIAQGTERDSRWRRGLPELAAGRDVLIGREPRTSFEVAQRRHVAAIPWSIPWDKTISRHHAVLTLLEGDRVRVTKDPRGRNPIFYRGQPRETFVVVPGEHFVIGETTFTLARRPGFTAGVSPAQTGADQAVSVRRGNAPEGDTSKAAEGFTPGGDADTGDASGLPMNPPAVPMGDVTEMAFAASALRQRSFRDTQTRIDLLARLPDLVAGSVGDEELFARVTDALLRATPSASAVAIVKASLPDESHGTSQDVGSNSQSMRILHYDVRDNQTESQDVSSKLVAATLRRRESVLHLWEANDHAIANQYTAMANVDWAFCVPLRSDACRGWVLYVTGSRSSIAASGQRTDDTKSIIDRLSDDVKFAEVVGSLISGIRQTNHFQQRHAAMRRFFAPVVLDAIAGKDSESWLQPRECNLSVMFCDLRGFSQTSEVHSDQLLVLLEQVSAALGVMTKHILETEGVIGDFHGDAAMGFWGWPLPLSGSIDPKLAATLAAANAASAIRRDYARGDSVFRCGIGIASGPAVAGRIGTVDQVKVTAFGPVVNLASRLEGLTKVFGVEVLVDQVTANRLIDCQKELPDDAPERVILRYLGRVRVAGIKTAVELHQLVVPIEGQPTLDETQRRQSKSAWDAFTAGDWDSAYEQLHRLPAWDRPKDVLLQKILTHHRTAPPGWDGVLEFGK
ncbi:adenylate/guanylate cyclase domain-containing protein [Neorhodopirellula pilleata]|uniref:Adenylate cyclase 1 n=1 Tax=Neorhodopirellula pilleata TaxID=2714738 RepID=A0A5C6AQZ8_9BACT|nr:adenylate/guanylate cyclase domain-containing protein [Neorhodopirellula pilleata]TWU01412.1 Adenylate cyclase 1 [Neorhodopirellula pilleata]